MEDDGFALGYIESLQIKIWGSFVEGNFLIMRVDSNKKGEGPRTKTLGTFLWRMWKGWRSQVRGVRREARGTGAKGPWTTNGRK